MRRLIYFHFSMLLIFSLPSVGEPANSSYPPPEVGSIQVRIYETVKIRGPRGKVQTIDIPLNDGQITVTKSGEEPKTVKADLDGFYSVGGLRPGQYRVTATVAAHRNSEKMVGVKKYKSTHVNINVKKDG